MVDAIPDNYPQVSPYLHVDGAAEAIKFYEDVFGAAERMRMPDPSGKIGHAELQLGDSVIMLADEYPDMGIRGPAAYGGSPVTISLYVEDVDEVFRKAIESGAKALQELSNQFYGDRTGQFEDPWGHRWSVASRVEEVSPEEMQRRAAESMGGLGEMPED